MGKQEKQSAFRTSDLAIDALPPEGASGSHGATALSRRRFLGDLGKGTVALTAAGILGPAIVGGRVATTAQGGAGMSCELGPLSPRQRQRKSYSLRVAAAKAQLEAGTPTHDCNGDEELYANKLNSFHKGLKHDGATGLVDVNSYEHLLFALSTGKPSDFEAIPLTSVGSPFQRRLTNPQAGLAFDLEGADSHALHQPPAPAWASDEAASEMVELYWMSLLRDIPASEWGSNPLAQQAAAELTAFGSAFKGPTSGGVVTTDTLFRDPFPGSTEGPYFSQFWFKALPYGAQNIEIKTQALPSGQDFVKDEASYIHIINGFTPIETITGPLPSLRYMNDGRAIAQWVHIDVLYQAYFQAFLAMAAMGMPPNPGNPYIGSLTQDAFGTFGGPFFATLCNEASVRALKAQWFQKWYVHRRARPEVYAASVHYALKRGVDIGASVHPLIGSSQALAALDAAHGTYLLPQAFPEASPLHPAYGSGHSTVAGACITMLKYLFDETAIIPDPVQPTVDGLDLVPYVGAPLTIGGELNKHASNVATGRNHAGIHWRSDGSEAIRLGQAVAVSILRDRKEIYNEGAGDISFHGVDGELITI
jgi:hypothetical protein